MDKLLFIAVCILALPLWVVVHIALDLIYRRFVQRFCKKQGFAISKYRQARCSESVLFELECFDQDKRRKLVRLLVWIFGIREVLGIEDFPDEPPPYTLVKPQGFMTRADFLSKQKACLREAYRGSVIAFVVFIAFVAVNCLIAKFMDEANLLVQITYGIILAICLIGFFIYPFRRAKPLAKKFELECPTCGRSLIIDPDRSNLVLETGRCWGCNARVLKSKSH